MTQVLKVISDKLTFKISDLSWRKLFISISISKNLKCPQKLCYSFLCHEIIVSFSKCYKIKDYGKGYKNVWAIVMQVLK